MKKRREGEKRGKEVEGFSHSNDKVTQRVVVISAKVRKGERKIKREKTEVVIKVVLLVRG